MTSFKVCDGPTCDKQSQTEIAQVNLWLTLGTAQMYYSSMPTPQTRFDFCSWRCLEEYAREHAT